MDVWMITDQRKKMTTYVYQRSAIYRRSSFHTNIETSDTKIQYVNEKKKKILGFQFYLKFTF